MNRERVIKLAMAACAVIVVIAVISAVTGLFGGAAGYADAEKYTAGDAEITGSVKNLDIHWTAGKVTVEYHREKTVVLRETSDAALGEKEKMHWWLDGDTLRVQYAGPGIRFGFGKKKELTLILPEGTELGTAEIRLTSGGLVIPEMKAEELDLEVTSGSITAAAEAKKVKAGATSGRVELKLAGETDSAEIAATSGSILLEAGKAARIKAGSTSGAVEIRAGEAGETEAGSTSGSVLVCLGKAGKLHASATSGNVTVRLGEGQGFTAEVSTTSGRADCAVPAVTEGGRYVAGDGSAEVRLNTTSGNIRIEKAE